MCKIAHVLRPSIAVRSRISFSSEELELISQRGLSKSVIYQYDPKKTAQLYKVPLEMTDAHRMVDNVTIERVRKNGHISEHFYNALEVQQWEKKMRNDILPALKSLIVSPTVSGKSETFEL